MGTVTSRDCCSTGSSAAAMPLAGGIQAQDRPISVAANQIGQVLVRDILQTRLGPHQLVEFLGMGTKILRQRGQQAGLESVNVWSLDHFTELCPGRPWTSDPTDT